MATSAGTAPAARPITIRHLLTHTSGISYGSGNPFEADYRAANVIGWYFADKNEPIATTIDRLAKLPMDSQPGDKYVYGFNTDILGVVVEKVSGQSLAEFFEDAHLHAAEDDQHRRSTSTRRRPTASRRSTASPSAGAAIAKAPEPGTGQGNYVDRSAAVVLGRRGPRVHGHPTTPASCRCCSTAARSTARGC